jgi:hypothetical protein
MSAPQGVYRMEKDDWYFLIPIILWIVSLIGFDLEVVRGNMAMLKNHPRRLAALRIVLALVGIVFAG